MSDRPSKVPWASSGQPDIAGRVRVEQMDALARASLGSAVTGTAAASVVGAMFWANGPHLYLATVLPLLVATYVASATHAVVWRSRPRPAVLASAPLWRRALLSGLLGLLWGTVPVALMPVAGGGQVLLGYLSAGLVASSLMIAPVLPAALLYCGSVSFGSALAMLLQHDAWSDTLAGLLLAYGAMIAFSSLDLHRRFTDRVLAQSRLEEQNEVIGLLLRDFEENSGDWLWQTDEAGHVVSWSDRLETVLGREAGAIDGTSLLGWVADGAGQDGPARRASRQLYQALTERSAFRDVAVLVPVAGEERWHALSGKPIHDRHGAFRGFRGVGVDVTAARRDAARIAHLARTDGLTGLPNRTALAEMLRQSCAAGEPFALLCLDLDEFKTVNDTLGHAAGDALLTAAAARMRHCLREQDVVARLGGDEFAVLQAGADARSAEALAARLVEHIGSPFTIDGVQAGVGISIGVALAPADGTDPEALQRAADLALYRAKHEGRRTWRLFEPAMDEQVQARRALQADLRHAIGRGEMLLHFQPILDLADERVAAAEALLRWRHPSRGAVSPADFIPLAEESGLIVPIGAWVLQQACAEAARWNRPVRVAVNLSPVQVRDAGLPAAVDAALAASGLPPDRLELEITESIFLEATDAIRTCLHALRDRGIRIALDDFGTGYSSLSYLRSFPFDKVKIDRSFVRDIADNRESMAIVQAITGMAGSLGMATTAEGVETAEQVEVLRARGCNQVQGFLFSRPVPAGAFRELLVGAAV